MNIKHRKDDECKKMDAYLGTKLLVVTIFLRIRHIWYFLLQDVVYGTWNSFSRIMM